MDPKLIYDTGIRYHHYANTAYPLTPGSFRSFRVHEAADVPALLVSEWAKADEVSLYVHIPFCKTRCKFCEYAVLSGEDAEAEADYVELLRREMTMYAPLLRGKRVVGLDVGGGTPAKLSLEHLERVVRGLRDNFHIGDSVVWSIETTPVIAAQEPEKISAIRQMGIGRISMGIQTVSEKLLNDLGREGTAHVYDRAAANIRKAGFGKYNIDLMYGFLHQSDEEFESTIRYAVGLQPDYITLYRNRYKGTSLEREAGGVSLYRIIRQYRLAYRVLHECGYLANPGKNTFSRVAGDYGTSDYLTRRVIDGVPYLGMGLGAQSLGMDYLAYNQGAASKRLAGYRADVEAGRFPVQDIYRLPLDESIAKMVSVAFYFGFVDLGSFRRRFGLSFVDHFKAEVDFVLDGGLMEMQAGRLLLTERGADYINGIIPLFFSPRSKEELVALAAKQNLPDEGEAEFLNAYAIENYARPSLAVDMVVAARQADRVQVVLVKRGDHPFMGCWALPGGFVRVGESAEQAAARELHEETGIDAVSLSQLGCFSAPGRDPRGWIVSCAFLASVDPRQLRLRYGDDALDARLFEVNVKRRDERVEIELSEGDVRLRAALVGTTIIENHGLAFDHASILALAMNRLESS
jgi:oxygen-independent coproporphyrinogen-3 oxidase